MNKCHVYIESAKKANKDRLVNFSDECIDEDDAWQRVFPFLSSFEMKVRRAVERLSLSVCLSVCLSFDLVD